MTTDPKPNSAAKPKSFSELSQQERLAILQAAERVLPPAMLNRTRVDKDFAKRVIEQALAQEPPAKREGITGMLLNAKDATVDFLTSGIFKVAGSAGATFLVTLGLGKWQPGLMQLKSPDDATAQATRFAAMSGGIGTLLTGGGGFFEAKNRHEEDRALWYALRGKPHPDVVGTETASAAQAHPQQFRPQANLPPPPANGKAAASQGNFLG